MTMMFEVEDLAVASPATVSRCGMVYMEPEALGHQPLIDSWLLRLPENITTKSKTFAARLRGMMNHFVNPTLAFVRKHIQEVVTSMNNNLVQSLMRILECYLVPYTETESKKVTPEEIDQLDAGMEALFYFSLVWSMGATGDYEGREKFNIFLGDLITQYNPHFMLPDENDMYESYYDQQ